MYITKDELNERLRKTDVQINIRERKRRDGVNINNRAENRLTNEDRKAIGILSNTDGEATQKEIAEFLGVSQNTVSLNSRGIKTVAVGVDKELREEVNAGIEKIASEKIEQNKQIQEQLVTNLAAALGHVANNLNMTDATEASKIAVDMSKILNNVNNKGNDGRGNRTAIIINVPAMKEEKSYQTITV
jgi:predicted transcriptional regulator